MGDTTPGRPEKRGPTFEYEDRDIFGSRAETNRLIANIKTGNDSECVLFHHGTVASKTRWKLKDLAGNDKRLDAMLRGMGIGSAFAIQRYGWPKLHSSALPTLIVSQKASGKTYAHTLYAVSRCILETPMFITNDLLADDGDGQHLFRPSETTSPEKLIIHPKFIIICPSQEHVESIDRSISQMKEHAYGLDATDQRRLHMPPVSRAINIHQEDSKLALRCNESDILIGTPPTIIKCLYKDYIHFMKCRKIFFDDFDVTLQLQNSAVRELIKVYYAQAVADSTNGTPTISDVPCQIHLFAKKWTNLLRQFMNNAFDQRVMLFGSLAEASLYRNIKFEVEVYRDIEHKCKHISLLVGTILANSPQDKIGIVSINDDEARKISETLNGKGYSAKTLLEDSENVNDRGNVKTKHRRDQVFVISDKVLEFEVEVSFHKKQLNDINHIIHASLPDDILTFDQRFRLAFKHIQTDAKINLTSTVFIGSDSRIEMAQQVYDLMSRSAATQTATKRTMRDFISDRSTNICWRWATTGLCRLGKLSRDDQFGTYCFDRHSYDSDKAKMDKRWPDHGLIKISITHVISPSEFYFRFDSYRKHQDGRWEPFEHCESKQMWELQKQLDSLKSAKTRSVELDKIKKRSIYGVYFPEETRVDRVRLLDGPTSEGHVNVDLEYSKLLPVIKIDHGLRVEVYAKNLIELPTMLADHPALCHRGLHLGYKPTDNEPNWLYKAKKHFNDSISMCWNPDITVWLRLNRNNCFWFENMIVSRKLSNIDSSHTHSRQPHQELHQEGLAELATSGPPGISPSTRLETMCKWNYDKLKPLAQYAYLRSDIEQPDILLFDVTANFEIVARQLCFSRQLEDLEHQITFDFEDGKLAKLNYFAPDVLCIARVSLSDRKVCRRALLVKIPAEPNDIESHQNEDEELVEVLFLDHGKSVRVSRGELYQAANEHIKLLPFQAFTLPLANIREEIKQSSALSYLVRSTILDLASESQGCLPIKCVRDEIGHLYLYVQDNTTPSVFTPLSKLLFAKQNIKLHAQPLAKYETLIEVPVERLESQSKPDTIDMHSNHFILEFLCDLVREELKKVGVESD